MATLLELAKIKHHAVRSDGAKFLDGERDDSLPTPWLTVSGGRVTLQKGLYDELLVVKGEASDEQIEAWAAMGAPFYDPSPVIPDSQIPSAGKWDQGAEDADQALRDAGDAKNVANTKARTFYQASQPTATGIGDIWFDTSDHNHKYWWDGGAWKDVNDGSPVDASKRPVTARGLGGDIEMDKDGLRFIRKADNEVTLQMDIETGSAYFKGDITGASGTFSGPVKSIDAEGNYSLLDEARLRFYRRIGNEDVLSYYVAQIATGEAVDGQVVDLAALGYRFFERPKIVLQPKLNRVFVANTTSQDVWMDWDVLDQTFEPSTGAASFRVRARTIIKGGNVFGSFTPNKLTTAGLSTTTTTGPGTTYLRLRISGYAYHSLVFSNARLEFRIRYRKSGASTWTLLDSWVTTSLTHAELSPTNFTYNVPSSGAVGYDVQVTLVALSNQGDDPRETPHLTIHEFEYRSGDTILSDPANPEIVSWIAIDGG